MSDARSRWGPTGRIRLVLERLDSGAIFAVDGQDAEGRRLFGRNDPAAREALAAELDNLTLSGERQRAEALAGLYEVYRETLTGLLEAKRTLEERRRVYFEELLPTFRAIKDEASALLEMSAALESLRESMDRVGPDDLEHGVDLDREDEVGRMAAAYDAMLSRLRADSGDGPGG